MAYLDSIFLARGSVYTPFTGGVGAIAKNVLLDVVVIKNGSGLNGKGGAHLCVGREEGGRRRRKERERERERERWGREVNNYFIPTTHIIHINS